MARAVLCDGNGASPDAIDLLASEIGDMHVCFLPVALLRPCLLLSTIALIDDSG